MFSKKAADTSPKLERNPLRESVETVVFVVVLVLMLKVFVVEAFVIPTGSMAETLFGYKKVVTCEECGYTFEVNATVEAEPSDAQGRKYVTECICPNCRHSQGLAPGDPGWSSGDRVLVSKFLNTNERGQVVVFKYPDSPQTVQVATQYIKRLVGLGGETIAIQGGDVYLTKALTYDPNAKDSLGEPLYPRPEDPNDLWRAPHTDSTLMKAKWNGPDYSYPHAEEAYALFDQSQQAGFPDDGKHFTIWRKPNELMLAMRRIVYDNDYQPKAFSEYKMPPRWAVDQENGWSAEKPFGAKVFSHSGDSLGWLRYRHLMLSPITDNGRRNVPIGWVQLPEQAEFRQLIPTPITNFMGYNAGGEHDRFPAVKQARSYSNKLMDSDHWVGDLMLECRAKIDDPAAKVVLELSKGMNRFQAEFSNGQVQLVRTGPGGQVLASRPTPITRAGKYDLRFANFDSCLRVWVNGTAIDFGDEANYSPNIPDSYEPEDVNKEGWTKANDINEPASIGATGAVTVSKLKLWRDTYYVQAGNDLRNEGKPRADLSTYYVQPGHYFCMGDNSSHSGDSRSWGLVPERLMMGRATFVFLPFTSFGFIK